MDRVELLFLAKPVEAQDAGPAPESSSRNPLVPSNGIP